MKTVIHDLTEKEFEKLYSGSKKKEKEDEVIFQGKEAGEEIKECTGCFCCWIKTPGVCILKDKYRNIGKIFSKSDEIIIISKCLYGGYSPFIKNILDRSIPFLLPFFKIKDREVHHSLRYKNKIKFRVYFYGENITEEEKETAKKMVSANSINFDFKENKIYFSKFSSEINF